MSNSLKIIHVTVVRKLTAGQLAQLKVEDKCGEKLECVDWRVVGYQSETPHHPLIRRIPFPFRGLFLRPLFAWLLCIRLSFAADFILLRHIAFDPFSLLFASFVRNRASVHHAKEIEELLLIRRDWRGRMASELEKITGKFALRRSVAVIGVTSEIARYEVERAGKLLPTALLPNGLDGSLLHVVADNRLSDEINAAFVCGSFNPWHGLDLLVAAVRTGAAKHGAPKLNLHLIGDISKKQRDEITLDPALNTLFVIHGTLSGDSLRAVLSRCDVGIGSLAMFRQNLTEGSTLKVRELLGSGIPVFSGHIDTALPEDFPFYYYAEDWTLDDLVGYCQRMKRHDREAVRLASEPFLNKEQYMRSIVKMLRGTL